MRKYSAETHALYDSLILARQEMLDAQKEQAKIKQPKNRNGERLIAAVESYLSPIKDSAWDYAYWNDKEFNEVIVDFR